MSRNEYKAIKNFLDGKDSIFETLKIEIGLIGTTDNSDNAEKMYSVKYIKSCDVSDTKIECNSVCKVIENLNNEINNNSNNGFKTNDSGWSVFFLIKECIQIFSRDEFGYNYYRGQRNGDWETIPSVFRNYVNEKGEEYYSEFEDIYQEIHKRYPDKISYIDFPVVALTEDFQEQMRRRGQELALLQHYDLYTPLLDITSNPYIALLFMTNGKLNNPQLEFYNISKTPLFMQPDESNQNSRIRAQRGAFLNYELLLSMTQKNKNVLDEIESGNNDFKIPRIILSIKYLEDSTKKRFEDEEKRREGILNKDIDSNLAEYIRGVKSVSSEKFNYSQNKETVYEDVRRHLRQKLGEFQYFENDLFPDFEDFLKNTMKNFLPQQEE